MRQRRLGLAAAGLCLALCGVCSADDLPALFKAIRSVGPEGKGSVAANKAWNELVRNDTTALVAILTALNDANPIAANYLRSAVDAIAERTLQQAQALPAGELETFVLNTKNS